MPYGKVQSCAAERADPLIFLEQVLGCYNTLDFICPRIALYSVDSDKGQVDGVFGACLADETLFLILQDFIVLFVHFEFVAAELHLTQICHLVVAFYQEVYLCTACLIVIV